jgi:hypothetical protein
MLNYRLYDLRYGFTTTALRYLSCFLAGTGCRHA